MITDTTPVAGVPAFHLKMLSTVPSLMVVYVADLTSRVDISELRAYRAAVGRQTREIIRQLSPDDLTQLANPERIARAFASGAVVKNGRWVEKFWDGKSVGFFLWLGTGHNFMHLGEANLIRTLVGAGPGGLRVCPAWRNDVLPHLCQSPWSLANL